MGQGGGAFALAAQLSPPALAAAFRPRGRLHVPGFLAPESAARMREALLAQTPWQISTNSGARHIDLTAAQIAAMTPGQIQTASDLVVKGAAAGFQYLFETFSPCQTPAPRGRRCLRGWRRRWISSRGRRFWPPPAQSPVMRGSPSPIAR
jgi:hypothetical protein